MKITKKEEERQEAIQKLRNWINKDTGIVIVIKSISKSGMSRKMEIYTRDLDLHLSYHVSKALDWRMKGDSVLVSGCGMDMAFHLAYSLSHVLYSEEERKELKGNGQGCLPWKTL